MAASVLELIIVTTIAYIIGPGGLSYILIQSVHS